MLVLCGLVPLFHHVKYIQTALTPETERSECEVPVEEDFFRGPETSFVVVVVMSRNSMSLF